MAEINYYKEFLQILRKEPYNEARHYIENKCVDAVRRFDMSIQDLANDITQMKAERRKSNIRVGELNKEYHPYKYTQIANEYGISPFLTRRVIVLKKYDKISLPMAAILPEYFKQSLSEIILDNKNPIILPPKIEIFLDAYMKLKEKNKKIIDKMLDDAPPSEFGFHIERTGRWITNPNRIPDLFQKRLMDYFNDYNINLDGAFSIKIPGRSRSFLSRFFLTNYSSSMEKLVCSCVAMDVQLDLFFALDYTQFSELSRKNDIKKPITPEEKEVVRRFLLADEDDNIWRKAIELSIVN